MQSFNSQDDVLEVCDDMRTSDGKRIRPTSNDITERAKLDKKTLAWVLTKMKVSLLHHFDKRVENASQAIQSFWQRLPIERHLDRVNDQYLSRLCLLALDISRQLRDRIYSRAEWKQILDEHTCPLRFCVEALKRKYTTDYDAEPMIPLSWERSAVLVGTYPEGNVKTTDDVLIALSSLNACLREVARDIFRRDDKPPIRKQPELTDHCLHLYNKWDIFPLGDYRVAGEVCVGDTTSIKKKQTSPLATHREEDEDQILSSSPIVLSNWFRCAR